MDFPAAELRPGAEPQSALIVREASRLLRATQREAWRNVADVEFLTREQLYEVPLSEIGLPIQPVAVTDRVVVELSHFKGERLGRSRQRSLLRRLTP